jgi:rfaE bifunctional protein nucleotidyltransferase chain/domain/rfaE bifunctional protein kinase chain/domain
MSVVVVGDVLLDVDLDGSAERLSPDAPVPVVHGVAEHARPGGAGLAATLAASVAGGEEVVLIAPVGDDPHTSRLRAMLEDAGVRLVALAAEGSTVRKTRVRAEGQTLVRIDHGDARAAQGPLDPLATTALAGAAIVLVSDYGRGTAAHPEIRRLLGAVPSVVWDPHPRGAPPVPGARLVTPNLAEARHFATTLNVAASGTPASGAPVSASHTTVAGWAAGLVRAWRASGVAVTMGSRGALLSVGEDVPSLLPAPATAVGGDTCGAGDCFAVGAAMSLRNGGLLTEAVAEGVRLATAFVTGDDLRRNGAAFEGGLPDPLDVVRRTRERGGTVVATGGCFDLVHAGHVELLRQARALGDCLVVCLNSDASVRGLKGEGRPVVGEADRRRVLAALDSVDAVLIFEESTPMKAIETIRPDLWVKGGDYARTDLPEASVVRRYGGEVVLLPYLAGTSTTRILDRVRSGA